MNKSPNHDIYVMVLSMGYLKSRHICHGL
jgi:hypothetical protein